MRRRGWSPVRFAGRWQLIGEDCISQRCDQSADPGAGHGLRHIRRYEIYRSIAHQPAKISLTDAERR